MQLGVEWRAQQQQQQQEEEGGRSSRRGAAGEQGGAGGGQAHPPRLDVNARGGLALPILLQLRAN